MSHTPNIGARYTSFHSVFRHARPAKTRIPAARVVDFVRFSIKAASKTLSLFDVSTATLSSWLSYVQQTVFHICAVAVQISIIPVEKK